MRVHRAILVLAAPIILSACATSAVVVGTVRAPIPVSAVKVYLDPPKRYERVAILESSSKASWSFSDQGKMDAAMNGLKEGAAKLGANGVLLSATGNQQTQGMVMVPTYGGGMIAVPANGEHKTANGMAIYVTEE